MKMIKHDIRATSKSIKIGSLIKFDTRVKYGKSCRTMRQKFDIGLDAVLHMRRSAEPNA